jgi:hypothetical protein
MVDQDLKSYRDPGDPNESGAGRDSARCSETIDMFAPKAHARASDPETSHAAAKSVRRIRRSQAAVLSCLKLLGPRPDTLLLSGYEAHRDEHQWPKQSPSGIRTRRKELVAQGFVADSGVRRRLDSGRMAIVWAVTVRTTG